MLHIYNALVLPVFFLVPVICDSTIIYLVNTRYYQDIGINNNEHTENKTRDIYTDAILSKNNNPIS